MERKSKFRPRIQPSQPFVRGTKEGKSWLSWLGLGFTILFAALSFVPVLGQAGQAILAVVDAGIQIGISSAQGSLSPLDWALNLGLAALPIASAIRAETRAGAAFEKLALQAKRKNVAIDSFKLSKSGAQHTLEVAGAKIPITSKQASSIYNLANLKRAFQTSYTGPNASMILRSALKGDMAAGALGRSTRQTFRRVAEKQKRLFNHTVDKFLVEKGAFEIGNLNRRELRLLGKELERSTDLNSFEVGSLMREKLPSSKVRKLTSDMKKKFSPAEELLVRQKTTLGKIRNTKGAIDMRTGKVNLINNRKYYKFVQALHYLDPKLAARKILTKAQHYAKVRFNKWAVKGGFDYYNKVVEKFANTSFGKFFRKVRARRLGIGITEVEEEMIYFPSSMPMRGIRVVPVLGTADQLVHIVAFFNPRTTNNKLPVVLPNRPVEEVAAWLAAPSKMNHYLDTYAFSRGGKRLGFAVAGGIGAMLGFLPISLLRSHLSLVSNVLKLKKLIQQGKYGQEWKDIWKTFERLGPHKLGKFVFGRYGIALVRGFQKQGNKKDGTSGRTIFSFSNEFKWTALENAVFRKSTSLTRSFQNQYQMGIIRERRYAEQFSRGFTLSGKVFGFNSKF